MEYIVYARQQISLIGIHSTHLHTHNHNNNKTHFDDMTSFTCEISYADREGTRNYVADFAVTLQSSRRQ